MSYLWAQTLIIAWRAPSRCDYETHTLHVIMSSFSLGGVPSSPERQRTPSLVRHGIRRFFLRFFPANRGPFRPSPTLGVTALPRRALQRGPEGARGGGGGPGRDELGTRGGVTDCPNPWRSERCGLGGRTATMMTSDGRPGVVPGA